MSSLYLEYMGMISAYSEYINSSLSQFSSILLFFVNYRNYCKHSRPLMKEIILQKSNFRFRENIYICRPIRRMQRLSVEYVKNMFVCNCRNNLHQ